MPQTVLRVLFLALAAALAVGCTSMRPMPKPAGAAKLLSVRYPYRSEIEEDELQFIRGTRVDALHLPALAKALPEVRFFRSNLRAESVDYPDVDILIAVSRDGRFAMCQTPLHANLDEQFIEMLRGASAGTQADQAAVGAEIARMFASVSFPCEVRSSKVDGTEFSAELWYGRTLWRRILVSFVQGRIVSVTLTNPRAATTQSAR